MSGAHPLSKESVFACQSAVSVFLCGCAKRPVRFVVACIAMSLSVEPSPDAEEPPSLSPAITDRGEVNCPICLGPLTDPLRLASCEHACCAPCLYALSQAQKHRHRCPLCRAPLELSPEWFEASVRDIEWSLSAIALGAQEDTDEAQAMADFLAVFPETYEPQIERWYEFFGEPAPTACDTSSSSLAAATPAPRRANDKPSPTRPTPKRVDGKFLFF